MRWLVALVILAALLSSPLVIAFALTALVVVAQTAAVRHEIPTFRRPVSALVTTRRLRAPPR